MTRADADAVAGWRYPHPYDFYELGHEAVGELLDPDCGYLAVTGEDGSLVGYCCFGEAGRVAGAARAGLYDDDALDLGLGLSPDLTGRGLGLGFVLAVLEEGSRRFAPRHFRLAVAGFNRRAILVYERAGFAAGPTFTSPIDGNEVPFVLMVRRAGPA
jgi:RimJ/RimL family protein N-acetyltransferase